MTVFNVHGSPEKDTVQTVALWRMHVPLPSSGPMPPGMTKEDASERDEKCPIGVLTSVWKSGVVCRQYKLVFVFHRHDLSQLGDV